MRITDVRIKKVDSSNKLIAVASITIDNCFVVHELRVIDGKNGLFVAMPSRKSKDGKFRDIVHPINAETRKMLEEAVIAKFKEEC